MLSEGGPSLWARIAAGPKPSWLPSLRVPVRRGQQAGGEPGLGLLNYQPKSVPQQEVRIVPELYCDTEIPRCAFLTRENQLHRAE
jgi:hypothetical protein